MFVVCGDKPKNHEEAEEGAAGTDLECRTGKAPNKKGQFLLT